MNSSTAVAAKYGMLLKERWPGVIHGAREYEAVRRQAESLIERYEDERFALRGPRR